jgi:hypothetical protein
MLYPMLQDLQVVHDLVHQGRFQNLTLFAGLHTLLPNFIFS